MRYSLCALLALAACDEGGDDPAECPEGFVAGEDNLCLQMDADSRNGDECGGQWSEPGFCWLPDPGQDLVHGL